MANLNRIILVGRLTADPEARLAVDGLSVTKFRLAVDRYGDNKATDFINIVAWQKLAEICGQYLKKGQLVLVEGRIGVRSYDDQGGKKKWVTEVVARSMKMLSAGKGRSDNAENRESVSSAEVPPPAEAPIAEFEEFAQAADDLPF